MTTPSKQDVSKDKQDDGQHQDHDAEADRITTIADLAARQERTESKLDQVLSHLTGGRDNQDDAGKDDTTTADPPPAGGAAAGSAEIAEQMRQAIRDVRAEAAHDADHARLRQPPPESQPREVSAIRGKARIQRVLFGPDK